MGQNGVTPSNSFQVFTDSQGQRQTFGDTPTQAQLLTTPPPQTNTVAEPPVVTLLAVGLFGFLLKRKLTPQA